MPVLSISGCRSGTGPVTWGQRSILQIMVMLGDDMHTSNLGSWAFLPDGTEVSDVLRRIQQVIEHFDTLRTRYLISGDTWTQVVDGAGDALVEVREIGGADLEIAVADVQQELRQTRFDIAAAWPVRYAVLTRNGKAAAVVWANAHVVADVRSLVTLENAIRALVGTLPSGVQPLDHAAFEESEAGHRRNRQAIAYWRDQIDLSGPDLFTPGLPRHQDQRFWYGQFTSPALARALDRLAVQHQASSSTVLLAGVSAALAEAGKADTLTMNIVAANRNTADTRTAIGAFSQMIPLTIRIAGVPWPDLVQQAGMRTIVALRRGAYDPRSLDHLKSLDPRPDRPVGYFPLALNDMRVVVSPDKAQEAVDGPAPRGKMNWPTANNDGDSTVFLWVRDLPDALGIRMMVDTERLSIHQAEDLMVGLEDRLLAEATN